MKKLLIFLCFVIFCTACKDKEYIYQVNKVDILPNNADKDKQKTNEQYLNIVYANLYQKALSPDKLVDLSNVIQSIGDKQVAYEIIISKMMNDPEVKLPPTQEMKADPEKFIIDTYKRFYVRQPTQAEKSFFLNFLKSHPNLTPEHIYFAFATSAEYYYY
jgi:hypothetical protein